MSEAKSIIIPTDFSEASLAALPWAKRLASVLDANVHAVFVVQEPQMIGAPYEAPIAMPSREELVSSAESKLDVFVEEHLGGLNRTAVAKVLVGRPADEIVVYSDSLDAAMIIMTTHGYSGVKHIILGSTTEAVLRQANCPVLSIRAG